MEASVAHPRGSGTVNRQEQAAGNATERTIKCRWQIQSVTVMKQDWFRRIHSSSNLKLQSLKNISEWNWRIKERWLTLNSTDVANWCFAAVILQPKCNNCQSCMCVFFFENSFDITTNVMIVTLLCTMLMQVPSYGFILMQTINFSRGGDNFDYSTGND